MSKPRELANRTPEPSSDWAAAATEARRRRDEAVKQRTAELEQERQQARAAANAWSPQHEIPKVRQRGSR
jgi:hypothetical protein